MITLKKTLREKGVRKVAIIDDAFDRVPLASDLSIEQSEWIKFFEDLSIADTEFLDSIFPRFSTLKADELMLDNEFVAVLWAEASNLSGHGANDIFNRYRDDHKLDLEYLERLEDKLIELDLECVRCGRLLDEAVHSADLVFADLFMGSLQNEQAFSVSSDAVKRIVATRKGNPPLVVLMSRSSRLKERRQSFRDDAELLEACFRVISKADILSGDVLERTLLRLAFHRTESLKLAKFLHALESGVEKAGKAAVAQLRKLAPSDHAQIQNLLLNEEGECLGAYLVDVFDALVLHELERDRSVVQTAKSLASWDCEVPPPPYIEDPRELQYLVYQAMFHHQERSLLSSAKPTGVTFGDILKWGDDQGNPPRPERDLNQVWLVITPACDLSRTAPDQILLVSGRLEALQPKNWVYKDTSLRTPVIVLENDRRFRIQWDPKSIRSCSSATLRRLLSQNRGCRVCGRLRYIYALEIQQKILSSLGRVGLPAPMPATFRTELSAHLVGPNGRIFQLDVPELRNNAVTIYVGRTPGHKLSICEDACDGLVRKLHGVDSNLIHGDARATFLRLTKSSSFLRFLEAGLDAPALTGDNWKDLKMEDEASPNGEASPIGYITRDTLQEFFPKKAKIRNAGIILAIHTTE